MNPYYNHHGSYDVFERRRTEYMGLFHMLRILNIFKIDGTDGDGINGSAGDGYSGWKMLEALNRIEEKT